MFRRIIASPWPVLGLWLFLAIPYVIRTPGGAYTHDYAAHVEYTHILITQNRFPVPGEGWETHQPPAYYLAMSFLAPHSPHHVLFVRLFAVWLGAGVLWLLYAVLTSLGYSDLTKAVLLAFLATTPHFLFIFSTYNNDVLATFCSLALWGLLLSYRRRPQNRTLALMTLAALLGLYTKATVFVSLAVISAAACYLTYRRELERKHLLRLFLVPLAAMAGFTLWMYGHNVKTSGKWLPDNFRDPRIHQRLPHPALVCAIMPPGLTTFEWATPYTDHELPVGKKSSLAAYLLSSSVFGEYRFYQFPQYFIWFVFWVHTAWLAIGLLMIPRSSLLRVMGISFIVAWLAMTAYAVRWPYGSVMDFRYVAWLWLPMTVLEAEAFDRPWTWVRPGWRRGWLAATGMTIVLQGLFILMLFRNLNLR